MVDWLDEMLVEKAQSLVPTCSVPVCERIGPILGKEQRLRRPCADRLLMDTKRSGSVGWIARTGSRASYEKEAGR
jgi:hypothetical protein